MTQKILISVTFQETRVALLDDDILQNIYIERATSRALSGNFYKGKIVRLLPGLQAAFVNIGLGRSAFLHKGDADQALHVGQELLVQVYKDPLGSKGARLTARLTLPARYLILTPTTQEVIVSQKITAEFIQKRLLGMVSTSDHGGYIFRTAAEHATAEDIETDRIYLATVWREIESKARQVKAGNLVYEELPLILRVLRDLASEEIKEIRVDDLEAVKKMCEFAERYIPRLADRIKYDGEFIPLFDRYGIEDEIQNGLRRKVELKSGAHLVFDQTEAMVTIDVNSGAHPGQEAGQAALKINLEAVQMIAHQLKLRNLGGMIIIDFIDMKESHQKVEVLSALKKALAKDSTRTEVSELTSLGLVQMTRKRVRETLERTLCIDCPRCQHRGSIKSLETLFYEIVRKIKRIARHTSWLGYRVLAPQLVIDYLKTQKMDFLKSLETEINSPIELQVEPSYEPEHYDVLPPANG